MVTLKVTILRSLDDLTVPNIQLNQHSPVDVMKAIALLAPKKKPPAGSTWLMRPKGWQPGNPGLNQFDSFTFSGFDETTPYVLIEVP